MKTRAYIKNLRQSSLHKNVFYKYVKFYAWEISIKGDILVQKIKVKKYIFQFLTSLLCYFFANLHITYKFRYLFLLAIYWYSIGFSIPKMKLYSLIRALHNGRASQ